MEKLVVVSTTERVCIATRRRKMSCTCELGWGGVFAMKWKVFLGKKEKKNGGKSQNIFTHFPRSNEVSVGGRCAGYRWESGSDDTVGAAVSGLSCK